MVKFVKDSYRNLEYFISNINKRRVFFPFKFGVECHSLKSQERGV